MATLGGGQASAKPKLPKPEPNRNRPQRQQAAHSSPRQIRSREAAKAGETTGEGRRQKKYVINIDQSRPASPKREASRSASWTQCMPTQIAPGSWAAGAEQGAVNEGLSTELAPANNQFSVSSDGGGSYSNSPFLSGAGNSEILRTQVKRRCCAQQKKSVSQCKKSPLHTVPVIKKLLQPPGGRRGPVLLYVDLEDRVPATHPLRVIGRIVNNVLAALDGEFAKIYADSGRPSIPPERLLRALLLQAFYTIRSETQAMEQLHYNLLYRWFVGLGVDEPVWVPTVFTKNRERLLEAEVDLTNPLDPDQLVLFSPAQSSKELWRRKCPFCAGVPSSRVVRHTCRSHNRSLRPCPDHRPSNSGAELPPPY